MLGVWRLYQPFLRAQGDAVRRRGDVEYAIGRFALGVIDFVVDLVAAVQRLFTGNR
jgi:hypothetical protein